MTTFSAKSHEVRRDWYLVDASGKVLGRLAAEIARRLRGKHKPEFTPHVDTGDFVVVVNAGKLRVTGNKGEAKIYYRHSTYPGGVYATTFAKMQARFPTRALEIAVKGMLPKGPLGYAMLKKLKSTRVESTPTQRSSLERWRSTHDRTILLRDRPAQKCRGARVHQAWQR